MRAGSVADVQRTRHPISVARAVMEKSPHVMLIGSGADDFAAHVHLEQVPPAFFFTERRWQELVRQLEKDGSPIPPRPAGAPAPPAKPIAALERTDMHKYAIATGSQCRQQHKVKTFLGRKSQKPKSRVPVTQHVHAVKAEVLGAA